MDAVCFAVAEKATAGSLGALRQPRDDDYAHALATRRELISMADPVSLKIGKRQLSISNPDKVFYNAGKFTKLDVIKYYLKVAPFLLPHFWFSISIRAKARAWANASRSPYFCATCSQNCG